MKRIGNKETKRERNNRSTTAIDSAGLAASLLWDLRESMVDPVFHRSISGVYHWNYFGSSGCAPHAIDKRGLLELSADQGNHQFCRCNCPYPTSHAVGGGRRLTPAPRWPLASRASSGREMPCGGERARAVEIWMVGRSEKSVSSVLLGSGVVGGGAGRSAGGVVRSWMSGTVLPRE
jgi:hypothetical protein